MSDTTCDHGRLISIEGLNGVGKTHLTTRLLARYTDSNRPLLLEEFSQRPHRSGGDLGRDLLRALIAAADGDPFLRGGHSGTETLLLLAIKMFDFEAGCANALAAGCTVIEGRSVHSIAVYQSLIGIPDDDHAAYENAQQLLDLAASWRPLPDITILITDDVTTAVRRAETRDATTYTPEQWRLHHRAADMFDRLAADHQDTIVVLDRRHLSAEAIIEQMERLVSATPPRCADQTTGQPRPSALCRQRCSSSAVPA